MTDTKDAEMMREAERKRQEAKADLEAKKRVREQIEADKRERAERAAREKAAREGRIEQAIPVTTPVAAAPVTFTANEARLRVRCPNGTWQGVLPADATLVELENRIQTEGKSEEGRPLTFTNTFPRKQLTDKLSTLRELGLLPNAALEASY